LLYGANRRGDELPEELEDPRSLFIIEVEVTIRETWAEK
jgi:hypothetical protein